MNVPYNNLLYIDSRFDVICKNLKECGEESITLTFDETLEYIQKTNPLALSHLDTYKFMLRRLIRAFFLGDLYATNWNGALEYTKIQEIYYQHEGFAINHYDVTFFDDWAIKRVVILL